MIELLFLLASVQGGERREPAAAKSVVETIRAQVVIIAAERVSTRAATLPDQRRVTRQIRRRDGVPMVEFF